MISGYHIKHHTMYIEKILPRRMSTTACRIASHFGQEMAQNANILPISCKNFSGVTPPNPHPVLGHVLQGCSVSRLPLFWLAQLSDSARAPDLSHAY